MQTFVPYESFDMSASVLDTMRLGKQRVETYQILMQLFNVSMVSWDKRQLAQRPARWKHPAMAMWAGHEGALLRYQEAVCNEWTSRGFKDTCLEKSRLVLEAVSPGLTISYKNPSWVGSEDIHSSHRSNLLRKDQEFYSKVFPDESPDLPYIWPTTDTPLIERLTETASSPSVRGLPKLSS